MDVEHDSQARLVAQVLNVCPKQTTQRMWRWNENVQTVIDGREPCPLIVRASRVKKVVANSAQSQQIQLHANQHSAIRQFCPAMIKS